MNILFIAHSFPYPLQEGVRLHIYHLLKNLSAHHTIDLACFIESPKERDYLPHISPFCRSITTIQHTVPKQPWKRLNNMILQPDPYAVYQYESESMRSAIVRLVKEHQPDVVHIDYVSMAQYASSLESLPKVFFPHDAVSMLFERNIAQERNWLYRLYMANQTAKMKAYETKVLPWFETTVVVSPVDLAVLQSRSPGSRVVWNPNGVDTEYFQPQSLPAKPNIVLFRGIMSFLPNYDAALFYAWDVMPKVWSRRPETEFWIVGDAAPKELQRLARQEPRIRLTGFVEDLRVPMAEATVIACPMRIGSGIKNKILESLAMAKAVVATPMSLAGIEAIQGQHLVVGETPEDLAKQTLDLLTNEPLRMTLGKNGREFVIKHHSWSAHAQQFAQTYEEAIRIRKAL